MEFTTCLGLHFQATRLYREALSDNLSHTLAGSATRACHPPWVVAAFKHNLGGERLRAGPSETQHPWRRVTTPGYALGSSRFSRPY
jgi:hypothetical protein